MRAGKEGVRRVGVLKGKRGGAIKVEFRCTNGESGKEGILLGRFKYSSLVLTGASR